MACSHYSGGDVGGHPEARCLLLCNNSQPEPLSSSSVDQAPSLPADLRVLLPGAGVQCMSRLQALCFSSAPGVSVGCAYVVWAEGRAHPICTDAQ